MVTCFLDLSVYMLFVPKHRFLGCSTRRRDPYKNYESLFEGFHSRTQPVQWHTDPILPPICIDLLKLPVEKASRLEHESLQSLCNLVHHNPNLADFHNLRVAEILKAPQIAESVHQT